MLLFNSEKSDDNVFHLIVFESHFASDSRSGFILINDFLTLATISNLVPVSESLNTEILLLIIQMILRPLGPLYHLASSIDKQIFKYELDKLI
jgi:hypothetical protein